MIIVIMKIGGIMYQIKRQKRNIKGILMQKSIKERRGHLSQKEKDKIRMVEIGDLNGDFYGGFFYL
jgi:hypothetical protein|tara:strand:+ start:88 stop:285 length:198 start_codon:yes stop_codon:yes gene_type:complete